MFKIKSIEYIYNLQVVLLRFVVELVTLISLYVTLMSQVINLI